MSVVRSGLPVAGMRLLLVTALLAAGLGAAGQATSRGELPVIYLDIPPFPQTPVVTALTQRGSPAPGVNYDLTLAPPAFFEAINRPEAALISGAYRHVVVVLVEYRYHDGQRGAFMTNLVLDGSRFSRPVPIVLSDDGHNRITALQFPDMPVSMLDEPHTWQLSLPPDERGNQLVLTWETPAPLPSS